MEEFSPKIIHEYSGFVVIDKPAGMIVNSADTSRHVLTVQDWAEKQFKIKAQNQSASNTSEFLERGGIVHRLDKETSGILIIATTEASFASLQAQFKNREVKKEYTALCHGHVDSEGVIAMPIGRLPWNRTKFGVLAEGRESETRYKVLGYKKLSIDKFEEELSLVQVFPQTGRTHQIRVHMRHIGHPIFADELYAGRKNAKRDRRLLPRHFLHASKISFKDPENEESVTLESSLPDDLSTFLNTLTHM